MTIILYYIICFYFKIKQRWLKTPLKTQKKVFRNLIIKGRKTLFGRQFNFSDIKNYEDFKLRVPVFDYETLKPYIEKIKKGELNVLWKGKPLYFAKTSGTTSGIKYIPITKESIKNQVKSARDLLINYFLSKKSLSFLKGKWIFLQGSPKLDIEPNSNIKTGRLSGIVAHHVPFYLKLNKKPSWNVNLEEDWEIKITKIIEETIEEDMTLISGIPPWVQSYFEKICDIKKGQNIGSIFKNLKLFIYGGVNYKPYESAFKNLLGIPIDTLETFPASEGFFAYQDRVSKKGLRLELNSGIFYEFIELADYNKGLLQNRISLENVKLEIDYVLIISTNAGLWAYNLGDVVRFISLNPYRIIFSGRTSHFISTFGEHVIAKEVDTAMEYALNKEIAEIAEFTVAPKVSSSNNQEGSSNYHEWFIEFVKPPKNMICFINALDESIMSQNIYYKDLRMSNMLDLLKVTSVPRGTFSKYMESIGKLGGQNKVPRLSDNRQIVDKFIL